MIPEKKDSSVLLPSIADIIFLSIFLLHSFSQGQGLLSDADTGYHIRAGEYIINTLSIPRHDLFSFLTPPIPWTAHEWLSEVIMAGVHQLSGLTGIVVFFSFLIALVYYLMFRSLRVSNGNIFAVIVVVILAFASSQLHWLARPHIFSLLLMVVWYHILDDYQYRGINRLFLLPPLMLLWVNLHGGFITGFILLGIYCAGNLIRCRPGPEGDRDTAHRNCRQFLKISLICLAASLVNPFGYHIILFPFNLVNSRFLMDHVNEFLSPNFHEPLVFKYLFLLTIALLACSRKRLGLIELALVLFFTNMALYSIRYVTLFAIIVAPIILRRADDLIDGAAGRCASFFKQRAERMAMMDASSRGFLWPLAGLALVVLFAVAGTISYSFDAKIKPVAAVEFLKKERIAGNMFDNDEFGDYIIYAAWPDYRVFFDGRSDMYGVDRMKEYYRITNFEPGWEKVIEKYGIDWIIYDANAALSRYLLATRGWRLIYADRVAHIFVRDIPKYRYLMDKYRDVRPCAPEPEKAKDRGCRDG